MIDLRSDTVTRPTAAMRQAMAQAEVGDDVYGEDPTVARLEALSAERLGFESGLFFPSGTMANQVAIYTHTARGDEVIVEAEAHCYYYEVAAMAALSGVQARTIAGERGYISPQQLVAAIRPDELQFPRTRLVCIENSHNRAGGAAIGLERMQALISAAKRLGIRVHVDGARIFHTQVATGTAAAQLVQGADSVMFCLSKGLCAPVGSVLVGSRDFIAEARKTRKLFGGGMRQAGILAAAGLIALTEMVDRLAEDHQRARRLAVALAEMGFGVDPRACETNMVVINTEATGVDGPTWVNRLAAAGVLVGATGPWRLRLVTHRDVSAPDIEEAITIFGRFADRKSA